MKVLIVAVSTVVLVGCTASIPVHHLFDVASPKQEGTLLVLPRTELVLAYDQVKTSYTPGIWTAELQRCKASFGVSAAMPAREFESKIANTKVPYSCLAIYKLGLDVARYDDARKQACSGDDPVKGWTRHSIGSQSLKLSAIPVRDPDNVYWVETPVRWLSAVDVTVKYGPAGTVDGAKTVATNAWSDFAVKAFGAALNTALPAGSGGPDAEKKSSGRPACTLSRKDDKTDNEICVSISKELSDLSEAKTELVTLIAGAPGASFDKQVELLTARIKDYEALFEGGLKKTVTSKRTTWIPSKKEDAPCIAGTGPSDSPRCRNRKLLAQSHVWLCGNGFRQDPATGRDLYQGLVLEGWVDESAEAEQKLAAIAEKSAAGFSSAGNNRRGLPYRIVPRTRVKANTQICTYKTDAREEIPQCADGAKPIDEVLPVPQYGWIGRLAPKAGGRKATLDVDYNADTGELVSVQVAGEGSDPAAIQDALLSRIKEDKKPTELDALAAEKERVVLLKDICLAYASLSAEKPTFCTK